MTSSAAADSQLSTCRPPVHCAGKLAKTSLLAREREIAKTATVGLQSFRDALTDLRDSLPDLDFINDEALEGLPDAGWT